MVAGAAGLIFGAETCEGVGHDNGRFEVTGLGQEYENVARLERSFEFETDLSAAARTPDAVAGMHVDRGGRTRQPDGSRGRATAR